MEAIALVIAGRATILLCRLHRHTAQLTFSQLCYDRATYACRAAAGQPIAAGNNSCCILITRPIGPCTERISDKFMYDCFAEFKMAPFNIEGCDGEDSEEVAREGGELKTMDEEEGWM